MASDKRGDALGSVGAQRLSGAKLLGRVLRARAPAPSLAVVAAPVLPPVLRAEAPPVGGFITLFQA